MTESFTLVFKGDLLQIRHDPLTTETPFGTPYSYGLGDFIARHDVMRKALNEIASMDALSRKNALEMITIARKALDEVKS